jgi:hypothetical protein
MPVLAWTSYENAILHTIAHRVISLRHKNRAEINTGSPRVHLLIAPDAIDSLHSVSKRLSPIHAPAPIPCLRIKWQNQLQFLLSR